ncbi:MAG: PepSY-like domain-containing protein, partial [Bacteroidales bacterium]|nr:PepSY-like domain-containing protein [Bacteroidales bacterium]
FARAEDVTWEKEDTVCTANFIYREKFTTAQFSVNGMWIETVEELDTRSLYAPIQRYIDQNYRDYRVSYAEKATRHDRNDYYYIELIAKKKSTQPHQVALYFDKTGRPRQQ